MYIGHDLDWWLRTYLQLAVCEYKERVRTPGLYSYRYDVECIAGKDRPTVIEIYSKQQDFTNIILITVGEDWIKKNIPKEVLAASIAERMLHAEKPYESQLSPA